MTKQTAPPPLSSGKPALGPQEPPWQKWVWPITITVLMLGWLGYAAATQSDGVELTYTQFLTDVDNSHVKTLTLDAGSGTADGTLDSGKTYQTVIPLQLAGTALMDRLQTADVKVTVKTSGPSTGTALLSWLLLLGPFLLIGWLWFRMSRKPSGGLQGILGVGRSRAKIFDAEQPKTKLADVAGYDGVKSEVIEVIDFLKNPERYRRAGAAVPRGLLMMGPPGTGKTLLARAVAGEAGVPFLSVTGSSFVEMFVGVGAARVRDLFAEARKRAPSIIFVDELDAIGQRRSGRGAIMSNDEREQTLNQLLSEMDGFDLAEGIVVLAATNRPEVLDPALLRPGRFDRQVIIPLPTLKERAAILAVHCRTKHLDPGVDLQVVARGTPGFSGADLANLANEAAIGAVRASRDVVAPDDFDAARDRILLGRREDSNVLLPEEKYAVAVHEAGHALVAALCAHADPVAKVTILPAGQTLGSTEQLPLDERHLYGEDYLTESLAVRLGGRAAELVRLGQGSSGAANDLAGATDLALKMVREFGLSAEIGPVGYPLGGSVFLSDAGSAMSTRPFAEQTQALIDMEVAKLLRTAEDTARNLILGHQGVLDELVDLLLEHETVDGSTVYELVNGPKPVADPVAGSARSSAAGESVDHRT